MSRAFVREPDGSEPPEPPAERPLPPGPNPVASLGPAPRRLRIVGEDEADPAAGLIGWRAPLALALEGAEEGDEVEGPGGRPVTVLAVRNGAAV